jgi:hypothetical protein
LVCLRKTYRLEEKHMSEERPTKLAVVCDAQRITVEGSRISMPAAEYMELLVSPNSMKAAAQFVSDQPPEAVILDERIATSAGMHDLMLADVRLLLPRVLFPMEAETLRLLDAGARGIVGRTAEERYPRIEIDSVRVAGD